MRKTIIVTGAERAEAGLLLQVEPADVDAAGWQPRGHVLVDSDGFAFLYIFETEAEFAYMSLPELVWPALKEAMADGAAVYAVVNGTQLALLQLHEELSYLIENIEGNANYGEEFVSRVEAVFLP